MADLPTGTVTFLFSDIEGSTRLLQQVGDQYANLLAEYQHLLRTTFQAAGGYEVGTQGDSFFVAFRRAVDALAAAAAAQRAIATYSWPQGVALRTRMGLHTGEPILGDAGYTGLDVHRAARICSAGHGGQVLLSLATQELVLGHLPSGTQLRDLGEHRLKDLIRRERIFQLVTPELQADFPPLRTADAPDNLRMVERVNIACLYISSSTTEDETRPPLFFTDEEIYLGRPSREEAGPTFIDLELPSVSRHHARIFRQETTYILENWEGKYGIGVYERRLEPGDTHILRHSDIFRIPDLPSQHLKCLFLIRDGTQKLPLQVEEQTRDIYVFGDVVKFTPLEYKLVEYLYRHKGRTCDYEDITGYLWPDVRREDRKRDLEMLLVKVRKKIRDASGGFTFMQTVRGQGVRLVI